MSDLVKACCVCHKIVVNGEWSEDDRLYEAAMKLCDVSHGYCTECSKNEFTRLQTGIIIESINTLAARIDVKELREIRNHVQLTLEGLENGIQLASSKESE